MRKTVSSTGARLLRATCISVLLTMAGAITHAGATGDASTAPSGPAASVVPGKDSNTNSSPAQATKAPVKTHSAATASTTPLWSDLTPAQQQALMPLSGEWDKMDAPRKKKWLALSSKFSSLKPEEQTRLQDRMREWAKLTPEQRRVARESYSRAKKLKPGEKTAEWQQYQQLPEEQKKKLADEAAAKKRVASLPPASQGKGKQLTSPSKSTLRREAGAAGVLPVGRHASTGGSPQHMQSVPQAAPQPVPQPAAQPTPAIQTNSQ
jgi:Protein of unknown function (DUF3106)